MVGTRNRGRQKEWHTVARMSLGTEARELSQQTELRASVFRKNGRYGTLIENGKKVIQFGVAIMASCQGS